MKFFYNEQLVRTSKTHHYTYACISTRTGKAVNCSSTFKGAYAEKDRRIRENIEGIEFCKRCIEAVKAGKKTISRQLVRGGRWYTEQLGTIVEYEESIRRREEDIKYVEENWLIVPLEERA